MEAVWGILNVITCGKPMHVHQITSWDEPEFVEILIMILCFGMTHTDETIQKTSVEAICTVLSVGDQDIQMTGGYNVYADSFLVHYKDFFPMTRKTTKKVKKDAASDILDRFFTACKLCSRMAPLSSPDYAFCKECACMICKRCDCSQYHLDKQNELLEELEGEDKGGVGKKKSKKSKKKEKARKEKEERESGVLKGEDESNTPSGNNKGMVSSSSNNNNKGKGGVNNNNNNNTTTKTSNNINNNTNNNNTTKTSNNNKPNNKNNNKTKPEVDGDDHTQKCLCALVPTFERVERDSLEAVETWLDDLVEYWANRMTFPEGITVDEVFMNVTAPVVMRYLIEQTHKANFVELSARFEYVSRKLPKEIGFQDWSANIKIIVREYISVSQKFSEVGPIFEEKDASTILVIALAFLKSQPINNLDHDETTLDLTCILFNYMMLHEIEIGYNVDRKALAPDRVAYELKLLKGLIQALSISLQGSFCWSALFDSLDRRFEEESVVCIVVV